jgi:hypothetical protein
MLGVIVVVKKRRLSLPATPEIGEETAEHPKSKI